MTDKSYVTLEQAICPVCGTAHDTGALLLDRRMRPTFDTKTATHYAMCPEHKKLRDDGFTALVECSNKEAVTKLTEAKRTGNLAHIKNDVFQRVFNMPLPEQGIAFIEVGVIDKLKETQE